MKNVTGKRVKEGYKLMAYCISDLETKKITIKDILDMRTGKHLSEECMKRRLSDNLGNRTLKELAEDLNWDFFGDSSLFSYSYGIPFTDNKTGKKYQELTAYIYN